MAFWITCHMKAKREQKKAEQIVIKLFSRNYARDLIITKYIYHRSFTKDLFLTYLDIIQDHGAE
jgi:hypothetical protein